MEPIWHGMPVLVSWDACFQIEDGSPCLAIPVTDIKTEEEKAWDALDELD